MRKKMVAVALGVLIMAGTMICKADEWARPVYGGWTNTTAVWTNHIQDLIVLRNYMIRAGSSNQTINIELIGNATLTSNKLLNATAVGAGTNTAPTSIYVPMEMGDSILIRSSQIDYVNTNKYVLYFQLNGK